MFDNEIITCNCLAERKEEILMTETEFRFKHSELIMYYQLIEWRLKAICAKLLANEKTSWYDKLDDYEHDPFGKMLKEIKRLQAQNNIEVFTEEEFVTLDNMRKTRNYWVHQCFSGYSGPTFRRGDLSNNIYGTKISSDLMEAIEWDERIVEMTSTRIKDNK